ncbi:helix-turn-helix domain-containing protein [Peribacillus loiseleuriae]|uniref:Insertion element IS150 protein InsJ-like helix-turn-helix domain-containing protein n=1 Tax=Peribacillus loiseleuriae TaxID=1679170 RepID=A0A0K9GTM6_9BACI|nr:helix-turn-helix domain-containing protein [Peribacillus loiseleuriae]KMY50005.1 hypothetical protein AC625_11190 [Peribacillus loiseleuriae]
MARIKYSKAEKLAILHLYKDGHHSIADISAKFSVDPGTIREQKRKYEVNGEEALQDKRGRKKEEYELTAEEKFKLDMKHLERENERLRAENAFLKKLEELERRRR